MKRREPRAMAYHGAGVWLVIYRGGYQSLVVGLHRAALVWLRIRWARLTAGGGVG